MTHVIYSKDCLQRVSVVGDNLPSIYQAHMLRSGLGGHGILDLEPELPDCGRCGEVSQMDAAFNLAGRRQDPQVDRHRVFSHVISLCKRGESEVVAVEVLRRVCIRCSIADMVSASLPSAAGAQSQ